MPVETENKSTLKIPIDLSGDSMKMFDRNLENILLQNPSVLELDCSRLKHVTSTHINMLWQAHLSCNDAKLKMVLKSPSPGLIRVLKILDLYEFFKIEEDMIVRQMRSVVYSEPDELADSYIDEFQADPESITTALENFLTFLKRAHLSQEMEFEFRTIFYEIATNIRTHSGIDSKELIVFSARAVNGRILLVFADSGQSFDITSQSMEFDPHNIARNRQKRGIGIAMIRKLTDKMSYVRLNNAINVVTLEKQWSRQS